MILIADSGSTKTAWCLLNGDTTPVYFHSKGINPYQQTEEEIAASLREEVLPQILKTSPMGEGMASPSLRLEGTLDGTLSSIYFYGAGCTPEKSPIVASALKKTLLTKASPLNSALHTSLCAVSSKASPMGGGMEGAVFVHSDMLGAARALCGNESGIVAILGTGSNSCLYNGSDIVANVFPLGFILGDEGSGAYIGKRLVGDVLKRQLPDHVCQMFFDETGETAASIIQNTYREPLPNRFLASLSPFCARHIAEESVHALLLDCFSQFFRRNILAYGTENRIVHLVGSVAYYYKDVIAEAASLFGYEIGSVLQSPIEGLVRFHTK